MKRFFAKIAALFAKDLYGLSKMNEEKHRRFGTGSTLKTLYLEYSVLR